MDVLRFLLERGALHNTEAVLFVRNDKPEVIEFHAFGEQRVRADYEIDALAVRAFEHAPRFILLRLCHRSAQKRNGEAELFEKGLCLRVMLLCKDLRRSH